ncbi:hypothetical protein WJX75_009845 [Coccomyxa subellipsoidea]|uniref:DNA/RNA-binding domain-containing protein n=1 Tax=Coccomyxa subellipsoidea TaxID=248742 RepID=A0ABR2YH76_9CHLO
MVQTLRIAAREKSFYDPAVRAVRTQLRTAYEAFLLQDYHGAQDKQAEQCLWKTTMYAVIEEFRRRIKIALAGGDDTKDNYLKARKACLLFLNEASLFYALLVLKLQAAYGSVGFQLDFADQAALDAALGSALLPPRVATLDCRISVYRCLICLGDLARYYTLIEGGLNKKDWSKAEKYYLQAVSVFPEGGNSFNQLAVLATYSDAALPAVYFYYRSLAVAHPFQVARENLLLLFEQNRVHYEQLAGSAGQGTGGGSGGRATAGRGRGRNRDPAQQQQKPRIPIAALLPKLSIRFVRVHGVLFTKINMDTFGDVLAGAFADLDDLLSRAPVARGGNGEARRSDAMLMQLAAMCMFVAWNINYAPPDQRPGYSEVLQRAELRRHVLALAYGYAAALTFAAAGVGDMRNADSTPLTSPLLAPLNVLLQWLATQPDYVRPEDVDEAEAKERCSLWRALAKLLLLLPPPLPNALHAALPEDWQLRAFAPLTAAHSSLEFGQPLSDQDGARLRLHRLLTAIHGIVGHHPASRGAAADTSQPAHVQEEHAAAAELHRAVQRVLSEAQSAAAPAGGPATAEADGGGGTAEAANGSGVHDAGLGFVSEDEDEEVILYQPGRAAEKASPAPITSAPAGHTAMDVSPQRALSAAMSHEVANLPGAPAVSAGNETANGSSFDPFSVYAGAHSLATPLQPQPTSPSRQMAAYAADIPSPMIAADLAIGQCAAAARTTGANDVGAEGAGPSNAGGHAASGEALEAEAPSTERLAPPPIALSKENGFAGGALEVPASGAAAAAAAAASRDVFGLPGSSISGMQLFGQAQQQLPRQLQPYAGPAAVAPPPSNLPQPSSSFASGSFSRRGSPAGAAASTPPSMPSTSGQLMGPPAPVQQSDNAPALGQLQSAALEQQQRAEVLASGNMRPEMHFGVPSSTQQLQSQLLGGANRQPAQQRPGQISGQGMGGYGAVLPTPPPATGLPNESHLFGNTDAGGAGALFGRDLFASQRAGMSRPNSMMSVTDAHAAAGTPLDSRPVSRSSVGHLSVRSQADTEGGRGSGTPQPGQLFGAAQQQGFGAAPQFAGAGAAGLSSVLAGSAYDAQQQQQQQHQQQLQQQPSWLNSSGFYMGGDRQPQAPPQPSGLGFYTRDSQSLEAQLLAQAYQSHLGAANNSSYGGLGAPGNMPGYLNHPGSVLGRLSEPALPAPGGGGWMAAGLGLGQQTAGGYGSLAQPSLQSLGYSAQPQSPWALPGAASTASYGAAGLGHATAPSFPQQRAADQTAGGLVLNGQHLEQQQQFQQFQPEQSLASLSNAELQQRLALMSADGGLGQGWASAVPSPAGILGVGVTTSSGVEAAASLPQQAFPGDALMKQASGQLAGMEKHAAAVPGGGAANGDAGWSWLDAFEARQKALAAQAAGAGANAFPFPGTKASLPDCKGVSKWRNSEWVCT